MTQPAQPGPAPPGGKSGAWDHSSHSPSRATRQRAPSSSPQHPPTHPFLPPPSSPVTALWWPPVCSPLEATASAGHVTHSDTSTGRLTETRPPTAPLTRPRPWSLCPSPHGQCQAGSSALLGLNTTIVLGHRLPVPSSIPNYHHVQFSCLSIFSGTSAVHS